MPSFDIIEAIKLLWALVRHAPKVRVLKDFAAPNDEARPYLCIENTGVVPFTVKDFGLQHSTTVRIGVNDSLLLSSRDAFIEFPHKMEPGATLVRYIPSNAIDLWNEDDVYVTFTSGKTSVFHVRAMND